ncbi:MAG TPA: phospholipase D-like domain-containing protein [Longimicrobiales bacterium]|nr:phospholipase D-like domain-containing protein [Longimicrobiales bacterium]
MPDAPGWVLILAAAGALAVGTAIVSLFFALGRRPNRMWTDEVGELEVEDFMRPLAALLNVPLRSGGTATLLNDGDDILNDMLQAIAGARRSINFMVYIWEPGRMSDIIFEALIERTRAGVQVRVLLDGLGGRQCPEDDVDRLRDEGGHVTTFRPARMGKLMRFHRRNHRRAIVIDGSIAYTGGVAVADHWLGRARNPDEWRDSMVRVEGCQAENVQSAFAELWAAGTGEVLTGDSFFPSFDDDGAGSRNLHSISVVSSPSDEEHPLRVFFFMTFLAARERLWITTPYFVPDRHTREVIKRRARAGVDVRVLMPGHHTDAWPIRYASHSYFSELLNAGVRVFEYQPTMLHTKHVVADGRWSVVGSANMDIRSKELNEENVLGILDTTLAAQLEATFLQDLENSREIDRVEWRRRGLHRRARERLCVLFAEQY